MTYPSGRFISYARNAAGQITQVSVTDAQRTQIVASVITYAPFGAASGYTDGAGQMHSRSFDPDGRITSYTLGSQTWLLSYDAAGHIAGQVDGANAANSAVYGYDALDRLVNAILPSTAYGYGYDAAGNRTSQSTGAATRPYTVDAGSNRLLAVGGTPTISYTYDANGSVTGDGTGTYGYDARGRLVQATAAGTAQYQFNTLGQRVKKSAAGGDTVYLYDGAGHLIAESDGTGTIRKEYVWLGEMPIAVLQ
jgi:YD repeat-containing protein